MWNKLLRRLKCKHENTECITNFYGDPILYFSTWRKIIRSYRRCKDCGKIIPSEYLDKECNIINFWLMRTDDGLVDVR